MTVIYMQGSTQTHRHTHTLFLSRCLSLSIWVSVSMSICVYCVYVCVCVFVFLSLSLSLSFLSVCLYPHLAQQFHVFSFFAVNLENLRNKTNAAIVVNERLSERECLVNYFLYHKILWQNFPSCHDNKATSLKFSWQNFISLLHLISRLERLL